MVRMRQGKVWKKKFIHRDKRQRLMDHTAKAFHNFRYDTTAVLLRNSGHCVPIVVHFPRCMKISLWFCAIRHDSLYIYIWRLGSTTSEPAQPGTRGSQY